MFEKPMLIVLLAIVASVWGEKSSTLSMVVATPGIANAIHSQNYNQHNTNFPFIFDEESIYNRLPRCNANSASEWSIKLATSRKLSSILIIGTIISLIFSFVGIFPAFFIHTDEQEKRFRSSIIFKLLLAFAAGSLLSQAFLHLTPQITNGKDRNGQINNGLICIGFLFVYIIIDKLTGFLPHAHAVGTLNLIANFFENSAHSTSVIGAFKSSSLFGFAALFATLVHLLPHEFADFALLLRDGYSRKIAVLAQLSTAFLGSIIATMMFIASNPDPETIKTTGLEVSQSNTIILCFTTAGFFYIALTGIIPDIVNEDDRLTSILQMIAFALGVILIYVILMVEAIMPSFFF